MTKFVVEGRHFDDHLEACTFAQKLARDQGRTVDVQADMSQTVEKVERKWLARMHPEGYKRKIILGEKQPPRKILRATGEGSTA